MHEELWLRPAWHPHHGRVGLYFSSHLGFSIEETECKYIQQELNKTVIQQHRPPLGSTQSCWELTGRAKRQLLCSCCPSVPTETTSLSCSEFHHYYQNLAPIPESARDCTETFFLKLQLKERIVTQGTFFILFGWWVFCRSNPFSLAFSFKLWHPIVFVLDLKESGVKKAIKCCMFY